MRVPYDSCILHRRTHQGNVRQALEFLWTTLEIPLDEAQCLASFGGNLVDVRAPVQVLVYGNTKVFLLLDAGENDVVKLLEEWFSMRTFIDAQQMSIY